VHTNRCSEGASKHCKTSTKTSASSCIIREQLQMLKNWKRFISYRHSQNDKLSYLQDEPAEQTERRSIPQYLSVPGNSEHSFGILCPVDWHRDGRGQARQCAMLSEPARELNVC
jgi:hypothetical protein